MACGRGVNTLTCLRCHASSLSGESAPPREFTSLNTVLTHQRRGRNATPHAVFPIHWLAPSPQGGLGGGWSGVVDGEASPRSSAGKVSQSAPASLGFACLRGADIVVVAGCITCGFPVVGRKEADASRNPRRGCLRRGSVSQRGG